MANITVDGKNYEVTEGQNLLQAVLSHHLDLPYFCWHPAMGSVGACRQCAVVQYANDEDQRGRLAMACVTSIGDGMRFSIAAPYAVEFRESVIEWLMQNHPHDCPVCEEGGECHLQDMTVMTGHAIRRYRGEKRTWENQYLGPFIGHEMNRCITCYRCVRFYRDYAGGTDLDAFGSRERMYFGRVEDGVLENEFAGNLVEVCPTGVFTDRPFSKQYTRKWDLQSSPSVCPGCSVGCNIFSSERYGKLKRIQNRYHGDINGYFLCDRGRFGSHFVNGEERLRHAGLEVDGVFEARGADSVLESAGEMLGRGPVIGIGSPRASIEANFALRELVGKENYCNGLSDAEADQLSLVLSIHGEGGARNPSLRDIETADAVIVLGEDVLNTAPRIALSLRQAVRGVAFEMAQEAGIPDWQDSGVRGHAQSNNSPLFIASILPTRIDDIATNTLNDVPQNIARVGFAIAHRIDGDFSGPAFDSEETVSVEDQVAEGFIERAVKALSEAKRPLIVSGTGCSERSVIEAAANIAWALRAQGADPALLITPHEANSMGAALVEGGLSLSAALQALASGAANTAVVLENDVYRRADSGSVDAALDAAADVIVLDSMETATAERASIVLPTATHAECTGTFVNYETRAQRFYQLFEPNDDIVPAWSWISRMARSMGRDDCQWTDINGLISASADSDPALSELVNVAPSGDYRVEADKKIPRQPHRYSGRTAMRADVSVHEPKTTVDEETPFSYSMEGENTGHQPGSVVPYAWTPGWNSNQSVFKFQQEVNGSLSGGDPGIHLLSPSRVGDSSLAARFRDVPSAFKAETGVSLVPVFTIFGSEELSGHSPPILERSPAPFLVLNSKDASAIGVKEGQGVKTEALPISVEVRIDDAMARGAAGIVQGLSGVPGPVPSGPVHLVHDVEFVRRPGGDPNVIARG